VTTDDLTVWLLFLSAGMFLASMGVLVYCCALLLNVRHKIKQLPRIAVVARDGNGRRIQERV
jgi:hypothetical protein